MCLSERVRRTKRDEARRVEENNLFGGRVKRGAAKHTQYYWQQINMFLFLKCCMLVM